MKRRWTILVGMIAAGIVAAFFLMGPRAREQQALEQTRRALKHDGFKVELAEFDFSTSPEMRERVAPLTRRFNTMRRPLTPTGNDIPLLESAGSNAAIVAWKQDQLNVDSEADLWPALRERMDEDRGELDAARDALLSGPIRFDLTAKAGRAMLLPHLASLKSLATAFGDRAVIDLHDGQRDAAWTNLLAATRAVTAWEVEPTEVSQLVRLSCAEIAYDATWQVLQASGWPEERLAALQHEWESVDFFKSLPETAAFMRASMADACEKKRQLPLRLTTTPVTFREIVRSPLRAWANFRYALQQRDYREHGSYENEKDLLLYYRDDELQLRRATKAPTWMEMRQLPGVTNGLHSVLASALRMEMQQLPGVTNAVPFKSKYISSGPPFMGMRQMQISSFMQSQGRGLLGSAAEAEARRRLLLAAIALERCRLRHGSYPMELQALVPEFLDKTPVDFMDGQPLRYRRTEDGHFVLYSVGVDCVDNGGTMPQTTGKRRNAAIGFAPGGGADWQEGTDLVWPRPASTSETQARQGQEQQAREKQMRDAEQREALREQNEEAARKANVEKLLTMKWKQDDPVFEGAPVSKLLGGGNSPGNPPRALAELLTLKRITTTNDPDIATFEVPIRYDVVTNIGKLDLLVDAGPDEPEGRGGELQGCERAANGDCLLQWNTTYDPPGRHALQAAVFCESKRNIEKWVRVKGPPAPFYSSNLCQFSPFYSQFNERGAILYAKLPESNGIYSIELKSPDGGHVKTLTGKTTNGIINVHWDLLDEKGHRYTNSSVDSTFNVTLPDSGRSGTTR